MIPYTNIETTDEHIIREFNENIDPIELKWHRDLESRTLQVVGGDTNWMIQLDNCLPQTIDGIYIQKGVYHRLIKGDGNLKLQIHKHVDI